MAIFLFQCGVDLEQEDDAAGFLGVRIEQNESGLLEMKQEGLINHVIAPGLNIGTMNGETTPVDAKLLVKDSDG